jgi:hypothetical protein
MKLEQFASLQVYKPADLPRWDWLDFDMVQKLDKLTVRLGLDKPLQILSLFRTPEENEACGGAVRSMHLLGKACDFVPPGNPLTAYREAEAVGFTGIGLYLNERGGVSMHVDNRPGASARWGKLYGVYGAIEPVLQRLRAIGHVAVQKPVVSGLFLLLTGLLLYYILSER